MLFSVGKPFKGYQLINLAQKINTVSKHQTSLPPVVEEFLERFTGYLVVTLVNLFSGYDQCTLDPELRNITAFHTLLRLMRMTILRLGYINTLQVVVRVMPKALQDQILRGRCEPFIDNVTAKPIS